MENKTSVFMIVCQNLRNYEYLNLPGIEIKINCFNEIYEEITVLHGGT